MPWVALPPEAPPPPPPEAPVEQVRAELLDRLAERRWQVETSGLVWNGVGLATDDRSKLLLTGALARAEADPAYAVRWKTADGSWVQINAAMIAAAYDAVFAHVAACFAREADLAELLQAAPDRGALEALRPAIEAFWP